MGKRPGIFLYGWVMVAAFLVISTIMFGELTSFGVFFKTIEAEFGLNRTGTSAIFSLQNLFAAMMSFVGGWAVDKYGPKTTALVIGICTGLSLILTSQTTAYWQLFITYSLLFSVIGVVYTMITSTVSRFFINNRGLALGIAGSGIGLGVVIIPPLATFFISSFGWRTAYLIMGLIALAIIVPLAFLLRNNPPETGTHADATSNHGSTGARPLKSDEDDTLTEFSLREASRTRSFWLIILVWLFNAFCYLLVVIHIVPYATDSGIPGMEAAGVLSLIGAGLITGRIVMGKVSDSIGRKGAAIACALLAALAMVWLLQSKDLLMLYIFGIVFGFANGGLDTSMGVLVAEVFGIRKIGIIMGTLQTSWGIGVVIGPAIGGIIFDSSGSYFTAFLIGAAAMFAIAFFSALARQERNHTR